MKFDIKLYRIALFPNEDDIVNKVLNYNFFDYEDSREEMFWRNLIKLSRQEYSKKYAEFLEQYLKVITNRTFSLEPPIDLTQYINSYTINITLNKIESTTTIEFKEDYKIDIKENDLIVIKENDKIIFIGFVIYKTTTQSYGEFRIQSATIGNIGYLYTITNIATNWSLAEYGVKGMDAIKIDIPLFQDRFNNKNLFQIIHEIYAGDNKNPGYFYAIKKYENKSNKIIYEFDYKIFNELKSFNTIFTYLKVLQLYFEQYEDNESFIWAEIEHGEHKVYNEIIANSFELFIPTFKNIAAIFSDIKNSMYNFFIDLDGRLVIRPPLYNYLPFDMLELENEVWKLKKGHPNYIAEDEIYYEDFEYDNKEIKTRSDARFIWPYVGEIEWLPSFYIDIKGLLKFGFRNEQPYTNPNAITENLATTLATITNVIENSITRNLTIKVKFSPNDPNRFQIGRLYYIEKYNMVGYLISYTRKINYDEYPDTTLVFSYLRNVIDVKPSQENIEDLASIYNRYGVFEKIKTREIDKNKFLKIKKDFLDSFYRKINLNSTITIPAFKVFPTILDFIELTYIDNKVINSAKKIEELQKSTKETDTNVAIIDNCLAVRDFKVKFQRYFKIKKQITTNSGYNVFIEFTEPLYLNLYNPFYSFIPKNISKLYEQYKKQLNKISVTYHNFKYMLYSGTDNLSIWSMKTSFKAIDFPQMSQKLFNRIVECDTYLKNIFPIYLQDYNNNLKPNKISSSSNDQYNNIFAINGKKNKFYNIEQTYNYFRDFKYRKKWNDFVLDSEGYFYIHPQFIVNFDFLIGNILMIQSKKELEKNGVKSNLLKAHEEGRAIDIVFPQPNQTIDLNSDPKSKTQNSASILYLNSNFLAIENGIIKNQVIYTQDFYNFILNTFRIFFDRVVYTNNVSFKVFENDLNIKPFDYKGVIFHLEVNDTDYININKELLG